MSTPKLYAAILLSFVLLFNSCSDSEGEGNEQQNLSEVEDKFVSYNLTEDIPKVAWSDLIEKIEITRLEETDQSLLSYVRDLYFFEDNVIFVSGSENQIFTFKKDGRLVNQFSRKGEGPEEYSSIQEFWLSGDTVNIYSRSRYIKKYTLAGDFISSTDIDYNAGHILPYDEGYALDMYFSVVDDSLFYNVVTLDENLERKGTFLKSNEPQGFNIFTSNNSLTQYKESFLYHRIMSDTVYIKRNNSMEPLLHFDFGNDWFFREKDELKDEDLNGMFNSELFWNLASKVSEKYAYASGWRGKGGNRNFLIDRGQDNIVEILTESNDEGGYNIVVGDWTEDGIYGSINSLGVQSLISELDENVWEFTEGTTLQEIESSENPALVKIKFKDSSEW